MRIKIYDKTFTPLTTLFVSSSTSDFNDLNYKTQVDGVGDASFVVRLDNAKVTTANMKHYNRVEIMDDDNTVRWVGVIVEKTIGINIMTVKCYGLAHILDKRVTGDAEVHTGPANTEIGELLTSANATEDTGITAGTMDVTTAVNLTFNKGKVLSSIKSIVDSVGAQYKVGPDRKLYVQDVVGQDLSGSVIFRFEKLLPEFTNILQFQVTDDGKPIISQSHGKSNTLTSVQDDVVIHAEFGLLEEFKNFSEINDQTTLDNATANNNQTSGLSPAIALRPDMTDNFDAGDVVRVILNNGFINIDTDYQILEKSVQIVNAQKKIIVRLNLEVKDFIQDLRKMRENLELLNRSV